MYYIYTYDYVENLFLHLECAPLMAAPLPAKTGPGGIRKTGRASPRCCSLGTVALHQKQIDSFRSYMFNNQRHKPGYMMLKNWDLYGFIH